MVVFLFGPCTWEPGRGVPGCRGGLRPFLLCSCSCLVFKRLPQEWSYLSSHLFTCTMGFAPIKWTCTAFFRPRQLTDRAILANRQTQEKKKDMKIQKLSAGWQYSMNSGPKGTLIMPICGKEIQFPSYHPNLGTKSHSNSWRISSALHEAKVNFECHLAPSWNYYIVTVIWALPLRNSGSSMNGVTRPLN